MWLQFSVWPAGLALECFGKHATIVSTIQYLHIFFCMTINTIDDQPLCIQTRNAQAESWMGPCLDPQSLMVRHSSDSSACGFSNPLLAGIRRIRWHERFMVESREACHEFWEIRCFTFITFQIVQLVHMGAWKREVSAWICKWRIQLSAVPQHHESSTESYPLFSLFD